MPESLFNTIMRYLRSLCHHLSKLDKRIAPRNAHDAGPMQRIRPALSRARRYHGGVTISRFAAQNLSFLATAIRTARRTYAEKAPAPA
jgi:hypothetical protein